MRPNASIAAVGDPLAVVVDGDVAVHHEAAAAEAPRPSRSVSSSLSTRAGRHHDIGASRGEDLGEEHAEAVRGASDDADLAVEAMKRESRSTGQDLPRSKRSRSSRLRILPLTFFGSSSMKSTCFGFL